MVHTGYLTLAIPFVLLAQASQATEPEFRCDTEIFLGDAKEPALASSTIFTGLRAYDFLITEPEEVTIYDFGRREFKLLHAGRKMRTTVTAEDLLTFTATYKTLKTKSELFQFCLQPLFEETFADDVLQFSSKPLSYRVTCVEPGSVGADQRYREFADWSARLNAMRPGSLPAFPRLELNKALAERGVMPEQIERTIVTPRLTGNRTELARSRHNFNWTVSAKDHRDIDRVGDYLNEFTPVEADVYFEYDKVKK